MGFLSLCWQGKGERVECSVTVWQYRLLWKDFYHHCLSLSSCCGFRLSLLWSKISYIEQCCSLLTLMLYWGVTLLRSIKSLGINISLFLWTVNSVKSENFKQQTLSSKNVKHMSHFALISNHTLTKEYYGVIRPDAAINIQIYHIYTPLQKCSESCLFSLYLLVHHKFNMKAVQISHCPSDWQVSFVCKYVVLIQQMS